jgi:hypothetical protein
MTTIIDAWACPHCGGACCLPQNTDISVLPYVYDWGFNTWVVAVNCPHCGGPMEFPVTVCTSVTGVTKAEGTA